MKNEIKNYNELTNLCYEANHNSKEIICYVLFTQDSFDQEYSEKARTYRFSSQNKAFQSSACGYSIFGDCLDGSDKGVRLDWYMAAEHGGADGWEIEKLWIEQ